ncbi:12-oxophytodienoate reductase [Streptomyces cinnamoneus]|uniref:12-oxophytodienoate reductase n=1 Tax=Streptomyces cinnamoneus TaxID=53446 RepID=A0A2G1XJL3_STRCJ|nr:12-oxophytodienoate reductase [Streptomyces cinnamoneus]PHQ51416.1 12-oxophytodienoate reductase [Streptomyces cinnamoneus]PPT11757.1 12-oxophytodienoate reductase [Streptomyces cinnamoneus]
MATTTPATSGDALPSRAARLLGRPLTLGDLTLKNRIAMAAVTRRHSPGGVPGEDVAAYYARRAAGGAGLIVTEGTYVGREAAAAYDRVPHFHGEQALAGWARVVERVHEAGGRIMPQLWHTGVARTDEFAAEGAPAETPSGIGLDGRPHGKAMTQADIDGVVEAFARAAADAERIGFDGVELHGAHGYLIDDFLWQGTNRRSDAYGGDAASRARFATEVVAAVRAAVSPGFPILFRFSQWKVDHYDTRIAQTPQELELMLSPLAEAGVDAFHASTRRYWLPEFEGSDLNLAGWTKKLTGKPSVTVGSVGLDQQFIGPRGGSGPAGVTGIAPLLDRLERDEFDVVAVARAIVADPQWPTKALEDRLEEALPYDVSRLGDLV